MHKINGLAIQFLWKISPHTLDGYCGVVRFAASKNDAQFLSDALESVKKEYPNERGNILNDTRLCGQHPLLEPSMEGFVEIMNILLSFDETNRGVVSKSVRSRAGQVTPLGGAVFCGKLECVKLILEDPLRSREEKMKWLSIKQGGWRGGDKNTPLEIARKKDHVEIVQVFSIFLYITEFQGKL